MLTTGITIYIYKDKLSTKKSNLSIIYKFVGFPTNKSSCGTQYYSKLYPS